MSTKNSNWRELDTLTVEQARIVLGLSRSAVYEAAKRGDLPTIRVGKRWIIPRHALEALLLLPPRPQDRADRTLTS